MNHLIKTRPVDAKVPELSLEGTMEKESKRESKRQSAKKDRDHSVYTQKAVRAKEALLEKSCAASAKPKPSTK